MSHIKIKHKRHILKTITWRIIATTFTILVIWILTGSMSISLGVGVIEFFGKMVLYYLHERAWYKYDVGIIDKKERTRKD